MQDKEMNSILNILLKSRITQTISELQDLDAQLADPNFELGKPDEYPSEARWFLRDSINKIHDAGMKLMKEKTEETAH